MCTKMLVMNKSPKEAFQPLANITPPLSLYCDAGQGPVTYLISIQDCLNGLRKGMDHKLFCLDTFDMSEYVCLALRRPCMHRLA